MSLHEIQQNLKAPKNQYNSFGKYKYRSCEDILEAVKPLLTNGAVVTISDEVKVAGDIVYVEATATYNDFEADQVSVKAQAGINPNRKGMDIAQSFGSSSSYARKYALNGLFLIDDTKDPDTGKPEDKPEKKGPALITEDQVKLINKKLAYTEADIEKFMDWVGVDKVAEIPSSQYHKIIKKLADKEKEIADQKE